MKWIVALFALAVVAAPAAAAPPKASGPLKAYKGPEGEIVVMVEVNDSKQMLVQFRKIGGELDGKTKLYELSDKGHGDKTVYYTYKRGSKTHQAIVLESRDGAWTLYVPDKNTELRLRYSEQLSQDIKLDEVTSAYKP